MGAFGSISLANKFGIVLGCLIFLTFLAGLAKLSWNKRKLRKHIKLADAESRSSSTQPKKEKKRGDDPRYLFGVRAIERGHFGGVAQVDTKTSSTDTLTTQNSTSVTPMTTVAVQREIPSPTPPTIHAEKRLSRNPSPLRSQPVKSSDLLEKSPLGPPQESTVIPPPVLQTNKYVSLESSSTSPAVKDQSTLISTASLPNSKSVQSRPTSFLPRFSFTEPLQENLAPSFLAPTSSDSAKSRKSYRNSAVNQSPLSAVTELPVTSPTYSAFPTIPIPPKSAQRSRRTLWPHEDLERPKARKPTTNSTPASLVTTREAVGEKNLHEAAHSGKTETSAQFTRARKSSDAVSLAALTGTPIESYFPTHPASVLQYPRPPPSPPANAKESNTSSSRGRRSISASTSHTRQSSSRSLSQARDSIQYVASSSRTRSASNSNRHSIQRDTLHYDPRSDSRNRSGSIQGRPVDFSKPRETPFVNRNTYSMPEKGHTPSSSTDSDPSFIFGYPTARSELDSQTSYFDQDRNRMPADVSITHSQPRSTERDLKIEGPNPFDDVPAVPLTMNKDTARNSTINHKLSNSLSRLQEEENLKRSGTVSVAKVERRKPQRVSSHGGEWEIDVRPGFARIETGSTSTSPVTGNPQVSQRFVNV